MKNRIVVVLMCFVLAFSVVSCDDQEKGVGYGSLSIAISNGENSKTIQPTDESLDFTTYLVEGKYGTTGEWVTYGPFFSNEIRIDQLEVGDWEFVVKGYNDEDILLAKSEVHNVIIRADGTEKETYTLYWIEDGYGSLRLSLKVQTSKVSTIECRMFEGDTAIGTFRMTKEDSVLGDGDLYFFEHCFENVPAGVYKAEITMKDDNDEQFGKTIHQSVHIHDGLESLFDFSWSGLSNMLPSVDVPKPCFDDGSSLPCDSKILLDTDEENTNIFYSFDGELYLNYSEDGIDLTKVKGISTSLTIWAYAEKRYMDKSDVAVFSYVIQHPDEKIHIEAKDPSCSEVGWSAYDKCSKCLYSQNYDEISTIAHDFVHHEAKASTCTEIGWDEYDMCTRCDYTTYKEIAALEHDLKSLNRVDDEWHEGVCSRCLETIKGVHSFKAYKCTECGTWGRGPAGGYVFYDRGVYTEGVHSWRFLEASPTDLRLVNGVPTVDQTKAGYSSGTYYFIFGYYRETSDGSNILLSTKTREGEGCNNTNILVGKMKGAAYISYSGTDTTSNYAARLCNILVYEVNGERFSDWFLPSKTELNLMYENLQKQELGSFANDNYWSSSEDDAGGAWKQYFDNGNQNNCNNRGDGWTRVRPVRAF